MTTRFVLLSTQRSGSTWVVDMLNSHPAIAAYSEMLLKNGRGIPSWGGAKDMEFWEAYRAEKQAQTGVAQMPDVLFEYLDKLYAPKEGIQAIGFKLMYGQADSYRALMDYMAAKQVCILHLIRRNLLRVILSGQIASRRKRHHARVHEKVKLVSARLDPVTLVEWLAWLENGTEKMRRQLAVRGLPYLEVFYEDLVSGHTPFDVLLRFLGVRDGTHDLASTLKQLNTAPLRELIANYEQVTETLAGTRFLDLLSADE